MKIKDLKEILYSSRDGIQWAVVYDRQTDTDIDDGSVEYIVKTHGDRDIKRIMADAGQLVFIT